MNYKFVRTRLPAGRCMNITNIRKERTGMLRIKLLKTGKKDRPMWRFIVVERTRTGKGRVADYIGYYNPHSKPKIVNLDIEKYEKWAKVGAQPTDTVLRLKGKFVDKNKDYQKAVKVKTYKKKKPEEEEKKAAAPKIEEKPVEEKVEKTEAAEENKEVTQETETEKETEKEAEEKKEEKAE